MRRNYEKCKDEYERGYLAGKRSAMKEWWEEEEEEERDFSPLFKRLKFEYNSANNTWDWERGSVVFGYTKEGEMDYFRISNFTCDHYPDEKSAKSEMTDRISDLTMALAVLDEVQKKLRL